MGIITHMIIFIFLFISFSFLLISFTFPLFVAESHQFSGFGFRFSVFQVSVFTLRLYIRT